MSSSRFDRRALFRAGALPLALPWLETRAHAAGTIPPRVIFFITPGGTVPNSRGHGTGSTFTLGRNLQPLAPHKNDLVVIDGIDNEAGHQSTEHRGDGSGHASSGCLLTGRRLTANGPLDDGDGIKVNVHGPSVDQVLAQKIGQAHPFPVLATRVAPTGFDREGHMHASFSWKGFNQPFPAEPNPTALFMRLFGEGGRAMSAPRADAAMAEVRARRRSILDTARGGLGDLAKRVSASDRQRLAAHETAVRALEARLALASDSLPEKCLPPSPPAGLDHRDERRSPEIGRAFMKEIALAFSCNLTRMAILQWSRCASRSVMDFAGATTEFHQLQHDRKFAELDKIYTFFSGELARLIAELKSVPEAGGTLFDNTVIVWVTEMADAATHTERGHQWVLAGSCGGRIATGRLVRPTRPDAFHNNLLLSIMKAMGAADTSFGDPAFCTGPMKALG